MERERKVKGKSEALLVESVSAKSVFFGIHAGGKLLSKIKSAKKSIKIVSPYLSEGLITEVLKEKAAEGVGISIITSASKGSLEKPLHKNALQALYPRFNKEQSFCKCLFIKDDDFVHAKFYIIDDEIAYLGSFNFTDNGIFDNYELSVTVEDSEFIEKLCIYFDKLFNKGFSNYEDKELSELLYPEK